MFGTTADLSDSSSLRIQHLDGGWIAVTPGEQIPSAYRTSSEVLHAVCQFLRVADRVMRPWRSTCRACEVNSSVMLSRVRGDGLLVTVQAACFGGNVQFVRWEDRPLDALSLVAKWLGYDVTQEGEEANDRSESGSGTEPQG